MELIIINKTINVASAVVQLMVSRCYELRRNNNNFNGAHGVVE